VGPTLGQAASLVGWPAHYGGVSAHASSGCLLDASRVFLCWFHRGFDIFLF
jgi:hypothetical protein